MLSKEFEIITEDISMNSKFMELGNCIHHGVSRLEHSYRVAFYSYAILKFLRLNYVEGTRAALLHDFFTDDVDCYGAIGRYRKHPAYALENAKKYFKLSPMQEDIILKHMFPITFTPPKYIESIVVDLVDDVCSIFERVFATKNELSYTTMVLVTIIGNFIKGI